MEDQSLNNESFLAVVERYLEENGSDALEKLIAHKYTDYSSNHHAGEIKPTDKAGGLTPNQTDSEGSGPVWEDITVMENMAKHEAAEPKQVKIVKENLIQIEKETTGVQVKEMVVPADAKEIKLPEVTSSEKVQTEWTCAVCQLTVISEQNLKSHLNGRKHKKKCGGMKTSKQMSNSDGSSPVTVMEHMAKHEAAEPKQVKIEKENLIQIEKETTGVQVKEMVVPADAEEIKLPEDTSSEKVQTEWTCAVCQLTVISEQNLKSHLNGRKHKKKCGGMKTSKQMSNSDGSSPVTVMKHMAKHEAAEPKQVKSVKEIPIQIEKRTVVQIKETAFPADAKEIKLPETNTVKEVAKKWICAVCQVTTTSEHDLKCHLLGRRHKEKREELNSCKRTANTEKTRPFTSIKETAFPADAKEIKLPGTNTVKEVAKKWICAVCQVTTYSEHALKCHLLGRRHKEKREELNSCKRTANTEKNPPFTSNMPDKLKHKQGKHALAGQKKESTDGKPKEKVQLGATTGQHQRQTPVKDAGGATYNSKLWCSFCDIRCPDEIAMAAHLNGKKHLAKLQERIEFC